MTVDIKALQANIFAEMCAQATSKGLNKAFSAEDIQKLFSNTPAGHIDLALLSLLRDQKIEKPTSYYYLKANAYREHIGGND